MSKDYTIIIDDPLKPEIEDRKHNLLPQELIAEGIVEKPEEMLMEVDVTLRPITPEMIEEQFEYISNWLTYLEIFTPRVLYEDPCYVVDELGHLYYTMIEPDGDAIYHDLDFQIKEWQNKFPPCPHYPGHVCARVAGPCEDIKQIRLLRWANGDCKFFF